MNTATLAADLDRLNSACDLCEQPPAHHVYYGRAGEHAAHTNDLCGYHAVRWDHAALSPDELDRLYATARVFSAAQGSGDALGTSPQAAWPQSTGTPATGT